MARGTQFRFRPRRKAKKRPCERDFGPIKIPRCRKQHREGVILCLSTGNHGIFSKGPAIVAGTIIARLSPVVDPSVIGYRPVRASNAD